MATALQLLKFPKPQPEQDQDELARKIADRLFELGEQKEATKAAKPPKKPRKDYEEKPPVALSEEELLRVLAVARAKRTRDWVLLLLMYHHGYRDSEVIHVRRSAIRNGRLQVQREKRSKLTNHRLHGHDNPLLDLAGAVEHWLKEMGTFGKKGGARPGGRRSRDKILLSCGKVKFRTNSTQKDEIPVDPNELLFPITRQRVWQLYREYAVAAGIADQNKWHPHCLKHTTTMHLLDLGVPQHRVIAWLGWSSSRTIEWYTRARQNEVEEDVDQARRKNKAFRSELQPALF